MAVPPKFADIGKSVDDLLKIDLAPFSVELNSQTVNGVKFTSNLKKETDKVKGDLKAKYFDAANGVTFTYAYNTDKKFSVKAEAADTLAKGLRVEVDSSIQPGKDTTSKNVKLGFGYKQEHVHTNSSIDILKAGVPVSADFVFGYDGFNAGAQVSHMVSSGKFENYALALSYAQPDYVVAVQAKPESGRYDISQLSASYFHQINNSLATGAKLTYNMTSKNTEFVLGTSYIIDSTSSFKGTLHTNGIVGLQYTQKVRPGVKATVSTNLHWTSPDLKAETGLSLVFDA